LDAEHVKGHFDDHGHPILEKFHERLARLATDEVDAVEAARHGLPAPTSGD
jgi:hypothetical protein